MRPPLAGLKAPSRQGAAPRFARRLKNARSATCAACRDPCPSRGPCPCPGRCGTPRGRAPGWQEYGQRAQAGKGAGAGQRQQWGRGYGHGHGHGMLSTSGSGAVLTALTAHFSYSRGAQPAGMNIDGRRPHMHIQCARGFKRSRPALCTGNSAPHPPAPTAARGPRIIPPSPQPPPHPRAHAHEAVQVPYGVAPAPSVPVVPLPLPPVVAATLPGPGPGPLPRPRPRA